MCRVIAFLDSKLAPDALHPIALPVCTGRMRRGMAAKAGILAPHATAESRDARAAMGFEDGRGSARLRLGPKQRFLAWPTEAACVLD